MQGAWGEGDAANHKQGGASSPPGEALCLQSLPQGVPGSCRCPPILDHGKDHARLDRLYLLLRLVVDTY